MVTPSIHQTVYHNFPDRPEQYRQATSDGTLSRLFSIAVAHATERIAWYEAKAGERAKVAKRIRWWALLLFAMGTLAPIILTFLSKFDAATRSSTGWEWLHWLASIPLTEMGYVMLATAGALVVFDQFFDASGSWIRFRQSQARLEVLLADFRYSWAKVMAQIQGAQPTHDPAAALTMLRDFVIKVELLAEDETAQWAKRFSEMIDSFDRNPNLKVTLGNANRDASKGAGNGDPAYNASGGDGAQQATAPVAPAPATATGQDPQRNQQASTEGAVTIRLAIVGADTLDSGSLQLFVDEELKQVSPHGLIELQLDAGHPHSVVATGRREGQTVRGELHEDITVDDENKSFALQL
ncbi:MAG TPA: SLATT domain-containing protein [Paraburkholderia sp.]|jgi:hypothetical protein|nr:SLATT domain-containing protein [Paraburkholderia sp.]